MGKPGATGLQRIIDAFGYSMKGIGAALKHESAFRQEATLLLIMSPAIYWLAESVVDVSLLAGSLLLVVIVELLNSAIEAVVDRLGNEWTELAGRAKDMGSAAVLFSLLNVLIIWGLYAYQYFQST